MRTVTPSDPPQRGLLSVCCAAMLVLSLAALLGQARTIQPGQTISAEMTGSTSHSYGLSAAAGQALHAVVNQLGVDVVVIVSGPDSRPLVEMDSPNGANGPEAIWVITERSGDHSIQVRAFEAGATGRYELHVDRLRSATSDDRKRVDLQTGVLAGNALIARGGDANVARGIRHIRDTANLARAVRDVEASRAIHAPLLSVDARASLETLGVARSRGSRPQSNGHHFER